MPAPGNHKNPYSVDEGVHLPGCRRGAGLGDGGDLRGAGACHSPGFPLPVSVAGSEGVRMKMYPRGTGSLDYSCDTGAAGSR